MSLQAIVLAGGLGSRLRPVVRDRPKVMAEVGGRPFLEHTLAELEAAGFERVILAIGYLGDQIEGHFGQSFGGLELVYSREQRLLGTGGGIRRALGYATAGPCFVLNGDTWIELDYQDMLGTHLAHGSLLTIGVRHVQDMRRFGAVEMEGARIRGFREKGAAGAGFVNAGVYLTSQELFRKVDMPEAFSWEQDVLIPHLGRLNPLAFRVSGRFIDIGVPEDYRRAQRLWAGGERGGA